MEAFLSLLEHRLVVSLISLLVGGYILQRIAERRAEAEARRKQILAFLESTSDALNRASTCLFSIIRYWNIEGHRPDKVPEEVIELFEKRFTSTIIGNIYMNDPGFGRKYDLLCHETRRAAVILVDLAKQPSPDDQPAAETVAAAEQGMERLAKEWSTATSTHDYAEVAAAVRPIAVWTEAIFRCAQQLTVTKTSEVLESRSGNR